MNPMFGGKISFGQGNPSLLDPEAWRNAKFVGNDAFGSSGGLLDSFLPQVPKAQMPVYNPAPPSTGGLLPITDPVRPPGGGGWDFSEGPSSTNDGTYSGPDWQQPEYGSFGDWASTAFPDLYEGVQRMNGWSPVDYMGEGGVAPEGRVWHRDNPGLFGQMFGLPRMMGDSIRNHFNPPSVETSNVTGWGSFNPAGPTAPIPQVESSPLSDNSFEASIQEAIARGGGPVVGPEPGEAERYLMQAMAAGGEGGAMNYNDLGLAMSTSEGGPWLGQTEEEDWWENEDNERWIEEGWAWVDPGDGSEGYWER